MDQGKLEALRRRFGGSGAGDVQAPEFKKVVDLLFRDSERRSKPYEGIATFLDAPLMLAAADRIDFSGLDIALVGVPMDLGVTNRPGSRLGPRAVRQIERIGPYNEVLKSVPASMVKVADIGDVPFASRFDLAQSHADIEAYYKKLAAAGVAPISVGGDHSISLPILKAIARDQPVGMLHIDAHCDTGGPFEGSKFHHGGPFREAVLAGVLDPERTIQIGIRGNAEFLWEFSYASGMTVIHAHEFAAQGLETTIARIKAVLGDGPIYISFDVDSLDPAFAPGTGTPEQGGLSTREAMAMVRAVAEFDIVGGDVVEVAPQYDTSTNTAQAAAQMVFEIFTVAALARARRQK
ncbi:MAG: agmatinase [Pseudomonadota bacterium]